MRHILYIFILLLACSCTNSQAPETDKAEPATDTIPVLVMQIQKCSKLYTAEYNIHKIVTHDDVVRLQGKFLSKNFDIKMPVGDRKIAIPIDATLKAYVDFKDFSEQNIVRSGNKITVILPDPKVAMTSSKVDHNNIKEFVSLTRSDFTDEELCLSPVLRGTLLPRGRLLHISIYEPERPYICNPNRWVGRTPPRTNR